jgi:nitrate reductase molybdenum cofactor assembly chaperone NarJ/NarW
MDPTTREAYVTLADAFCYPAPGRLAALQGGQAALPTGAGKDTYAAFVKGVARLSLGEWEELHTRTLDLNPPAAPYVGYQTWGESYQRGAFLAKMSRALAEAGVDADGELPDHLAPTLRYLAAAPDPLPEMIEVLGAAVGRMLSALRKAEPENPYVSLLQAVQVLCQGLKKEDA